MTTNENTTAIVAQTNIDTNESRIDDRPFGIPEEAYLLGEDDWGNQLWAFKENVGGIIKYGFQVVEKDSETECVVMVSEPLYKTREQLIRAKGFDFILNTALDFARKDIPNVRQKFNEVVGKFTSLKMNERCSIKQVYDSLREYVLKHQEDEDAIKIDTVGQDQYANIPTKGTFDTIINDLDCGWKPLEVKKTLKRLKLLRITAGRPYDYADYDDEGEQYRAISLRLKKKETTENADQDV